MGPHAFRLIPVLLTLALALPVTAHADSAAPPTEGASAAIEVAARIRRPAARAVRVPSARRAYWRALPRRSAYRPYHSRPVYVAPYRPGYGYGRPMRRGGAWFPGTAWLSLGGQMASAPRSADSTSATSGFGAGTGFELGYGFRPVHALGFETAFGMTFHDIDHDATDLGVLGHLTFDARIYLGRPERALHPYLLVGLGAYFTGRSDTDQSGLSGIGLQAGGGLDYFLSRAVSIGVKATYRGAFLDDSDSTFSGHATESAWLSTVNLAGDLKFHF